MEGQTLSHYQILEKLGGGGMGLVYKAQDLRLDRFVALKFLPPEMTRDDEAKRRFMREAKAASALDHAAICTIYEIDETPDGQLFIAMAYYDGETLRPRIQRGPLPVDEALDIAIQVGQGLARAHESGIVHRDIKPGNVMLTPRGEVKILDFGLAKLVGQTQLTKVGTVQGTAVYMSPEQTRGEDVDQRADIWALGVVLYEMATGQVPFKGQHHVAISFSIALGAPTPMTSLRTGLPMELERIANRALAKNAADRYQTMPDLLSELRKLRRETDTKMEAVTIESLAAAGVEVDEALTQLAAAKPAPVVPQSAPSAVQSAVHPAPAPQEAWRRAMPLALAVLITAVVTGGAVWGLMGASASAPRSVRHLAIDLPSTDPLALRLGFVEVALSPAGQNLIYVGTSGGEVRLYQRPMAQPDVTPIRGTEGARVPFFSPGGQWVGFAADGMIKKVSLAGGPPLVLCDAPGSVSGASWGPDDTIVFAQPGSGLAQVSADGGVPEETTTLDLDGGELDHRWPEFLPRGNALLFTAWTGSLETARIVVQELDTGDRRTLVDGAASQFAPTGHIVFAREDSLWAVPFDLDLLDVTGPPVRVREGVQVGSAGAGQFTLAADGSLVYVPSVVQTLVWVDREGRETPLSEERGAYLRPRLSPDGRQVAVSLRSGGAGNRDIWVHSLDRGTRARVTIGGNNDAPVWTPDGTRITFSSTRSGSGDLYSQPADGSGEPEPLLTRDLLQDPTSWSPDGRVLTFIEQQDIWVLSVEDDNTPEVFLDSPFNEQAPKFSPDGRWLAYVSDESDQNEVYVQAYPGPGGKVTISTDGGQAPVWSADGRELFYRNGNQMLVVAVQTEPSFTADQPQVLFEGGRYFEAAAPHYDVSPDGERFVMLRMEQDAVHIVLNWLDELAERVPTN